MKLGVGDRLLVSLVGLPLVGGAAVASAAASSSVAVSQLLHSRIASVKQRDGGVPVLVPTTMALGSPEYTSSSASKGSYHLEIAESKHCDGANVCLYALFGGERGGRRYGSTIALAQGVKGSFADIQCGASCSPASIDWIEKGVLYTIQANPSIVSEPKLPTKTLEPVFIEAADQAIEAGPR